MAQYKECRHVMPSGLHCQSPAMRGSVFCYFHGRAPRPARPVRSLEINLDLPPIIGPGEIVGAVGEIIQALAANRISTRRAGILLQGVQMASSQILPGLIQRDAPLDTLPPRNSQPHPQHPIAQHPIAQHPIAQRQIE
jgi:hypothetical protein